MMNDPAPAGSPSRKVLVVDDCRDSAGMMRMLLKLIGHDAHAAFDGPSAVEAAISLRPEVVLLDLTLPGKGGRQVALELRAHPATADALIVGISGHNLPTAPPGFDHMLLKPVNPDHVFALIAAGRQPV
jgi:CheY-like chemotaxis protein